MGWGEREIDAEGAAGRLGEIGIRIEGVGVARPLLGGKVSSVDIGDSFDPLLKGL